MGTFRKLLRRGFYAAAAVSTLLLLATLILWPVSYYRWLSADYGYVGWWMGIGIHSGRLQLSHQTGSYGHLGLETYNMFLAFRDRWSYLSWNTPDIEGRTNSLGLGWMFTDLMFAGLPAFGIPARVTGHFIGWYIPFSYLTLLFSILPLLAFRSIRRRRKLARVGLCGKCGYDLRAHAIGEKCPECGTVIAKKP